MTLRDRLVETVCLYPIIQTLYGLLAICAGIVLWMFSIISTPLMVIIVIGGWWYIGNAAWMYEAWKASGPRGTYWNPSGYSEDMKTRLVWWTFGVFISMAHVFFRNAH